MEVNFANNKMQIICCSQRLLQAEYGTQNAKKIMMRLNEMYSVDNLSQISTLPPPRRHVLYGDRAGQFAVYVKHPFRIVFISFHDMVPTLESSGVDVSKVTKIKVIWIGDYHGE